MMKNKGKPKSKLTDRQKTRRDSINSKYKEHIIDYFPRDSEANEGLIFNKAPVVKENLQMEKIARPKKKYDKEFGKRSVFADEDAYPELDSDDEFSGSKRVKTNDLDLYDDLGEGMLGASQNFVDYFMNNQSAFKSLSKMGNFVLSSIFFLNFFRDILKEVSFLPQSAIKVLLINIWL
jgi:hypothetical protein